MPMKRLLFLQKRIHLLLLCFFAGTFVNANDISRLEQDVLEVPEFSTPDYPAYENDLIFGIFNPNGIGYTEVYRSLNGTDGFEHIASVPAGETNFLDQGLRSNTTYYYKLRAELDGSYSEFSRVLSLTTGFKLYPPILTAHALTSTSVRLELQDVSYNDVSYDIWREMGPDAVFLESISAPDSGEVFVIIDTALMPGTKYSYRVDVHAQGPGNVYYPGMVRASATTLQQDDLTPPSLSFHEPPTHFTCGNEIGLFYSNPNEGALTEIYRSRNPETGFELVHSTAEGSGSYVDKDLVSRKTYYYRARAVMGESASEFSETISQQTGSGFYEPEFTLHVQPNQTVEVTVRDKSYLDYSYEIYGWDNDEEMMTIWTTFQLPDSGNTFTIVDTLVQAGHTYTYHINVQLDCDGQPMVGEFVSPPVTIEGNQAEMPEVTSFTLVDPATDMDVAEMVDGMSFEAADRLNIRANANEMTESVMFYLNGKPYWGENQTPYALFGDTQGDYHRGRLSPGEYTLTAVPFSENLRKGVEGEAKTIYFVVTDEDGNTSGRSYVEVNVFPNPVVETANIEVTGDPDSEFFIDIVDQRGNHVKTVSQRLDNFGWFAESWNPANLERGTYLVTVSVSGEKFTKRVIIK